jgi:hypothetical protein
MQTFSPAKRSVSTTIEGRIRELTQWIAENARACESEQRHLDEGSMERAYWHYGYLCALRDVLSLRPEDN